MPVEGVGSAVEKAAPLVKFPVLVRIVFPGALAALCIYPFKQGWTSSLPVMPFLSGEWSSLVYAVGTACILGMLISGLRGVTYKVYAGHLLWPSWLFSRLRELQQSRVLRLWTKQENLPSDDPRYGEIWQILRLYPPNDKGIPEAKHPTLLGNIITAYEKYPLTRYGMDSTFYWPRIWLVLEKEKKEEIDASWSVGEGLLSLSAVSFVGGLTWAAVALARFWGFRLPHAGFPLDGSLTAASFSVCLLILGYFIYLFSLGFHARNGETFKAVFDLYREQLNPLLKASAEEIVQWRKTWAYLQYLAVEEETPKIPAQPTLITTNAPPPPPKQAPAVHHRDR